MFRNNTALWVGIAAAIVLVAIAVFIQFGTPPVHGTTL
jgi:hypothetical protein